MKDSTTTFYSTHYPNFQETGYYYQLIQNRPLITAKHRHDFFEVFVILDGNAAHICDGVTSAVGAGSFVFLSPENVHAFEMHNGDISTFSLSITPERFARFVSAFEASPSYGKVYTLKNEKLLSEVLRLPSVLGKAQTLLLNAVLADLFSEIVKQNPVENEGIPRALQGAIEKFRSPQYIGQGVEKLAELAGVSRMHLGRLLKKYYGKTPVEFLLDIRMRLAAEYLEKTSYTLDIIAENIGFSSISRFHAAFKGYFHCTPNTYRKRLSQPQLLLRS